jgi:hypothetical protein
MKLALASIAIFGVALLASAQKDPARRKSPQESAAEKIAADLKEARALLKDVSDKKTREKLELLIGRAELAAKDLQAELAALAPRAGMTKEDFAKVLKNVKDHAFDDGKRKTIEALPKTTRITSAQAKELLATFSFDRDRVPAGVHLHGLVVDPELFVTVLDAFTFKSSKDELLSKIKGK